MRITPLASGSLGNSLLAEFDGYRLLIDAGLELSELEQRLETIGVGPGKVDALFLTHRHRDHVRAATGFAREHRVGQARPIRSSAARFQRGLQLALAAPQVGTVRR